MRRGRDTLAVPELRRSLDNAADPTVPAGRRLMAFTVRELAGRLDTTETTIRNAIAAAGVRPVGREVRLIQRMAP